MLSQAHRRSIHTSLEPILGEEETATFMSEFPASESDMPASKTDLHNAMNELRIEMHQGFTKLAMWMGGAIIAGMVGGTGVATAVAQALTG